MVTNCFNINKPQSSIDLRMLVCTKLKNELFRSLSPLGNERSIYKVVEHSFFEEEKYEIKRIVKIPEWCPIIYKKKLLIEKKSDNKVKIL